MKTILARRVSSLFITSIMMVAVGLFLFIGLLNHQHDLTILCILVFGIAITLKVWAKLAGKKIIYRLATDRYRVFPGEKFTFTATIENHKPLPVWLEVEAPVDGPLNAFAEPVPFTGQQTLLWYQRTRFQWQLTTLRRGIYEVGPLRTISGDLLGFFQNESINNERLQVVVYPRIVPLAPLTFRNVSSLVFLVVKVRSTIRYTSSAPPITTMAGLQDTSIGRQARAINGYR